MNNLMMENMKETRNELIKLIESLSFEEFNAKPTQDKWSIAQICHHIVLVELSSVKVVKWGLKESKYAGNERKDLEIILDRTIKVQAPDVVKPGEGPYEVQQIIDLLDDAREQLLKTVREIVDPSLLREKSVMHPALGPLRLEQWIEYLPYHEKRHMEQIREIIA